MSLVITGLDTETTGLDPLDGHEIIEICMASFETDDLLSFRPLEPAWTQRIKPTRPIDKGAEQVHGIALEDLRLCPPWRDVAPEVHRRLQHSHLMVAHNLEFDALFLAIELKRVGLDVPDLETYCTMVNGRDATAMGKLPSLREFCWAYDVDYDEDAAHAAEYDVGVMMQALFTRIRRGRVQLPLSLPLPTIKAAA